MATGIVEEDSSDYDVFPTVDQFAYALSSEPHWYNLGIFFQLPSHELNRIGLEYRSEGTLRCLIEVYKSLESLNNVPTWEYLSKVLRKINNVALANEVFTKYVLPKTQKPSMTRNSGLPHLHSDIKSVGVQEKHVTIDVFPTVAQFAEALSSEQHWYNLGIFLRLPTADLKNIELEYRSMGTQRCLIELYNSLESLNKVPTWEYLYEALKRSNNVSLANEVFTKYVSKTQNPSSQSTSKGHGLSDVRDEEDPIFHFTDAENTLLKKNVEQEKQTDKIAIGNKDAANVVKTHIDEEGVLKLRIVKALLLGGPGVGKTTTLLRLLSKIINLATSSDSSISTGVDTAKALHLHHDLYKDCTKMSVMIEEDWKGLKIEEQAGVLVNCVSNSVSHQQEETSKPSSDSSQHPNLEKDTKHPLSNDKDGSVTPPIKHKNSNPHTVSQKFKEIEDLIAESNWKEVEKRLQDMAETTILHVIDTGGQPEFFEILPLILRGPSLCLLFLSLVQCLTKYFDVTFRSKETPSTEYTSSYTPIQMIQQVLASLKSLNDSEQESAACLIATHLDEVSDRDKISEFEDKIEKLLRDASFYEDILCHFEDESGNNHSIFPLDNKNGTELEINLLRKELTQIIRYNFTPEPIKTSWGFFHLVLLHHHEDIGFCSLQEATSLAKRCGIHNDNDVTEALKFFHNRFGTILYFGDVPALKDLVFCNLNLVFHPITKLVAESFGALPYKKRQAEKIRKTGEIEETHFRRVCTRDDKTNRKPVNSEMIVALLKHVHIITKLPNGNLFMSCLLHPYQLDELKRLDELSEMNPAPLLFTFDPSSYQPVGLFHALMASLLLKYKDRFQLHEERYRNKINFLYNDVFVTILSTAFMLEIQISKADKAKCLEVKKLLWDQVHDIIEEMPHMRNIKVCLGFYCPKSFTAASYPSAKIPSLESDKNPQVESPLHIAIMLSGQSGTNPTQVNFRCKKKCDNLHPITLQDKHKIWFEHFHSDIKSVGVQEKLVIIDADTSITDLKIPQQDNTDVSTEDKKLGLNKALSQSIRTHNAVLCHVLTLSKVSLHSLTHSLFGKVVIDDLIQNSIMNNEEEASRLLAYVRRYLEGDEDDHQRYKNVMECFENEEILSDTLKQIKEDIQNDRSRKRPNDFRNNSDDDIKHQTKKERPSSKFSNKSGKLLTPKIGLRKRRSKDDSGDTTDNTALKKPRVDNDSERKQDHFDCLDPDSCK